MTKFLHALREFFAKEPCAGCAARDYMLAILREQLHQKDQKIQEIEMRNDNLNQDIRNRLDFISGMNRNTQPVALGGQHSLPRNFGIGGRIARAEAADRENAAQITAERQKEYQNRIADLEKKDASDIS